MGDHWVGELASSALATATAVGALAFDAGPAASPERRALVARGRAWLAQNANDDGGWGDTVASASNVATTALAWGAFAFAGTASAEEQRAAHRAKEWLEREAGGTDAEHLARALGRRYGKDRTFAAPIFAFLAASGRLGQEGWERVSPLPFELARVPPALLGAVRLPVVSYALPALIAIGQLRHHRRPSRNPLVRALRSGSVAPTLDLLGAMQPGSGGYLEAVPLTSFVALSLMAAGRGEHPVVVRGLRFLEGSARADGSWAIDTDLATWVTTLSVTALGPDALPGGERQRVVDWILACQHREVHPYTRAAPGGWAWTDRPGGVPDADDTAGALLALADLAGDDPRVRGAAESGIDWLLGLQNRDGGMPTFCRGWGALPFDRSSPDLTAHAMRAWTAWRPGLDAARRAKVDRALRRALGYLRRTQLSDGAWVPLWFGSEKAPREANPVYGTARVLPALALMAEAGPGPGIPLQRGTDWLLRAQNPDGGWGGGPSVASSIEETALAVSALAAVGARHAMPAFSVPLERGIRWLVERTDEGRQTPASPIGLYFARLWYWEALYPLIFATAATREAAPQGRRDTSLDGRDRAGTP